MSLGRGFGSAGFFFGAGSARRKAKASGRFRETRSWGSISAASAGPTKIRPSGASSRFRVRMAWSCEALIEVNQEIPAENEVVEGGIGKKLGSKRFSR